MAAAGILLSGSANDLIASARAEVPENGPRWGLFSGTSCKCKRREQELVTSDVASRNSLYYEQRHRLYPFLEGAACASPTS